MTKSKIVAALAAITLAGSLTLVSAPAQAHHHHGHGFGIGLAAGALFGAAIAANAQPAYGDDCYNVVRYDRWGHRHLVTVCNDY
jgi:hypothetical protein